MYTIWLEYKTGKNTEFKQVTFGAKTDVSSALEALAAESFEMLNFQTNDTGAQICPRTVDEVSALKESYSIGGLRPKKDVTNGDLLPNSLYIVKSKNMEETIRRINAMRAIS